MRAIIMNMSPEECDKIANRNQTMILRKTKPKLDAPHDSFKVYMYCAEPRRKHDFGLCFDKEGIFGVLHRIGFLRKCNYGYAKRHNMPILSGKVIGEFVCDSILSHCEMANADIAEQQSRIKREKILEYANGKEVYGYHISDLVFYNDKPKDITDFYTRCYSGCDNCKYDSWDYGYVKGKDRICTVSNKKPILKMRGSWCYTDGMR